MAAPMFANSCKKMILNRLKFAGCSMIEHRTLYVSRSLTSEAGTAVVAEKEDLRPEEFRVYEIPGLKKVERKEKKKFKRREVLPPRYLQMPVDQDWTKVWPAATSFKYSVVPFPVRQGFIKNNDENKGIVPGKYANAELMKIPNFLHLTPAHVKKHTAALKQFCTEWPENLTKDNIYEHFPVKVTNYSYCFSGSSLRHPKARVVKVTFNINQLGLDYHAKDKFIRLVGDRYNEQTGIVTLEADRCPVKIQNYEYIKYLITALFYESQKTEPWESEKEESDWERLYWEKSQSRESILKVLKANKNADASTEILKSIDLDKGDEEICQSSTIQNYKVAVCEMLDEGEDSVTIRKYKESVLALSGLKKFR